MSQNEPLTHGQQQWMLMQAYTRLNYRQYEACVTILKGLKALIPNNDTLYPMISYAYLQLGSFESCLEAITQYESLIPKEKRNHQEVEWIKKRAQLKLNKKTSHDV
ncbi:MAG: hypothetical protein HAW62_02490 [Endozoicomonadaceae bacterium]|nr:hypothetical protein [Endozoicomonadaceae bacterium]